MSIHETHRQELHTCVCLLRGATHNVNQKIDDSPADPCPAGLNQAIKMEAYVPAACQNSAAGPSIGRRVPSTIILARPTNATARGHRSSSRPVAPGAGGRPPQPLPTSAESLACPVVGGPADRLPRPLHRPYACGINSGECCMQRPLRDHPAAQRHPKDALHGSEALLLHTPTPYVPPLSSSPGATRGQAEPANASHDSDA